MNDDLTLGTFHVPLEILHNATLANCEQNKTKQIKCEL